MPCGPSEVTSSRSGVSRSAVSSVGDSAGAIRSWTSSRCSSRSVAIACTSAGCAEVGQAGQRALEHPRTVLEVDTDLVQALAGVGLGLDGVPPGLDRVGPGLDGELPAARLVDRDLGRVAVGAVADQPHPGEGSGAAVGSRHRDVGTDGIVALAEDGRGDGHDLPDDRARRPAAARDDGRGVGDRNASDHRGRRYPGPGGATASPPEFTPALPGGRSAGSKAPVGPVPSDGRTPHRLRHSMRAARVRDVDPRLPRRARDRARPGRTQWCRDGGGARRARGVAVVRQRGDQRQRPAPDVAAAGSGCS